MSCSDLASILIVILGAHFDCEMTTDREMVAVNMDDMFGFMAGKVDHSFDAVAPTTLKCAVEARTMMRRIERFFHSIWKLSTLKILKCMN